MQEERDTKEEFLSWVKSLFFAIAIAIICRHFLFTPVTVHGESMMPTFENKNKVVITKVSKLEHFDMIVFHSPVSEDNHIKRLIGLPGDTVEVKDDTLYINGKEFKEPYLKSNKEKITTQEKLTEDFKVEVPEDSLFVMGDNRRKSGDSRIYGFIHRDSVIGEVKFRYYPVQELGIPK
ncbi:signal peptidase I [Peribacillus alkalitolerans]|uniref:signal peptidase I n=1 Tax=Peribacillus alkalitolerans TaxID=1550385 RepID=UPI0013D16663|nr:signal peptidase I [Peribacillus alkalitolerans]